MGGESNIGYDMVLTKIFKKVKIDVKSKAPRKHKGDFNHVTLKRMKLPLVPPREKFMVMGETAEEQLHKEELEYPNSVTVQTKRRYCS